MTALPIRWWPGVETREKASRELAGAGKLYEGDSVRLVAAGTPVFTAGPSGAELLVWETA